jgi:hypothetical protein
VWRNWALETRLSQAEKNKNKSNGNQYQQDAGKGPIQKSWKLIEPKSGEPETKQNVNGRTFHGSSKCKCWSALPGTSGHTGGRGGDNAHTQVNMEVPLLPDPLVWNIKLPLHSSGKTFLNVPFVFLTSVLLMMLFALRMILQEPDLEQQCCHFASHHHILHRKWTHDDANNQGSVVLYL